MKIFNGLLFAVLFLTSCAVSETAERDSDFNADWLFALNIEVDASSIDFDDSEWRSLNLPHDWSVEFPFDSINGEGATGYLPGGIGWYRKHFSPNINEDEKLYILFDGVYNRSEYWINGTKLGFQPYGYSPFYYDLTPYIKPGEENVLAVKVDHSRYVDSRWYTGSGIYRDVEIIKTNKLHIPVWGTFISTPEASSESAKVLTQVQLQNEFDTDKSVELVQKIYDPMGELVYNDSHELELKAGASIEKNLELTIENPKLWGVETPLLYLSVLEMKSEGEIVDSYKTRFGIRYFHFDAEKGFFLNGEHMKIKGVCLHHDGGLVGAAVPKGVWKRRLQTLMDGGCNAVRISHNPASVEFLELCDEIGMLVQDEFYDEWDFPKDKRLNMYERHDDYISSGHDEFFQEYAEQDLKNVMLSHRNHPSIFQWSIGNEIEWTYPRIRPATGFFDNMNWDGNYFWSPPPYSKEKIRETYNSLPALEYNIGETAQKLAKWTRELDTTRPVIANCILPSASFETGYTDALDIVGFSYRRVMYDYAKENYPGKVIMGTENVPQWHEWKAIEERDFVSGTFLWTGIDYMGERNGSWPLRNQSCGLLDQAGFKKTAFHMYKTLWTDEAHVYVCSNSGDDSPFRINKKGKIVEKNPGAWEQKLWYWHDVNAHWNYEEGEDVIVEVYSNCAEVELFLNDESLGVKRLEAFPDRIMKWAVPFEEGVLEAKGVKYGKASEMKILTVGEPVKAEASVDVEELMADGYDVAHVEIQLVDDAGNPVTNVEREVTIEVEGPAKILGVDNGWDRNVQTYQSNKIRTYKGRALCIVQSEKEGGVIKLKISGEGLETEVVELAVRR